MKKILIILLLILSVLLIGCSKEVIADTIPVTSIVTATSIIEDTAKIDELTKQLDVKDEEVKKYQDLIGNLNNLLKNVYYGYASNSKWTLDGFTAFSIEYKGKYYIITAGHCVENEYGKFSNFKFKANFSDTWIYPKLLSYNYNGNMSEDYAIFYSDKINDGFRKGKYEGGVYVLGQGEDNIIKVFRNSVDGESGSPVININGEVLGIITGKFTDIDLVLQAIDN